MNIDLEGVLAALETENEGIPVGQFRARPVPGFPPHYVARDATGLPCILLKATAGPIHPPIRLKGFEARFAVPCQITIGQQQRHETLTVVACLASERESQSYFLHVCEAVVRLVGQTPSLGQVVDAVHRLVALFKRLSQPASRSVTGLIGELYVIACSPQPTMAARAWRSADQDRFDFALDDVRIEVKATSDRVRAHHFSAEQCAPPIGILGLAISVFVESSGGGLSLLELVHQIEQRLGANDDLILKVQETVAATLGDTLMQALSMRFDEALARSSLQLYDLSTIPAVRDGIPAEVTQVRFRSDLSQAQTASLETVATRSALALAIIPAPLRQ